MTAPAGHLAQPDSTTRGGVLVLHAWWGLNTDIRQVCDQLASEGFVAFAPDLFGGQTATTQEGALKLVQEHQSKEAEITAQIQASAEYLEGLTGSREIGVLGYSFGAYYALSYSNLAPDRVRAVVIYYGTGVEDFSESQASYLGHFAEQDDFEPQEAVDGLSAALAKAARPATIHGYEGTGHWFAEPSVESAYDAEASALAWSRSVEFLLPK